MLALLLPLCVNYALVQLHQCMFDGCYGMGKDQRRGCFCMDVGPLMLRKVISSLNSINCDYITILFLFSARWRRVSESNRPMESFSISSSKMMTWKLPLKNSPTPWKNFTLSLPGCRFLGFINRLYDTKMSIDKVNKLTLRLEFQITLQCPT